MVMMKLMKIAIIILINNSKQKNKDQRALEHNIFDCIIN